MSKSLLLALFALRLNTVAVDMFCSGGFFVMVTRELVGTLLMW